MSRIVICQNDFPKFLLPEGATEAEALALCRKLEKENPTNIEQNRINYQTKFPAVHFNWSVVQEYTPQ